MGGGVGQIDTQHPKPPKYPLKIKYLQVQGVGGVEGAGLSVCMATIIYAREIFATGSAGFVIQLE